MDPRQEGGVGRNTEKQKAADRAAADRNSKGSGSNQTFGAGFGTKVSGLLGPRAVSPVSGLPVAAGTPGSIQSLGGGLRGDGPGANSNRRGDAGTPAPGVPVDPVTGKTY